MKRVWLVALAAAGGCDLYIPKGDPDARFNDGRPPADAVPLDAARDAPPPPPTLPAAPTRAHVPVVGGGWVDDGPADWSCLGVTRDVRRPDAFPLTGRVLEWHTRRAIDRQFVNVVPSRETGPLVGEFYTELVNGVSSYQATLAPLPFGTRYGFRLNATDGSSQPQAHVLDAYFPPGTDAVFDLHVVSRQTAEDFNAAVGAVRNPDDAMVLGDVVDCRGRRVSNAKVVVSLDDEAELLAGFDTVNFSADAADLPYEHNRATRADGRFGVLRIARDRFLFVQVSGFRTPEELEAGVVTRIAAVAVLLPANAVATVVVEPRQN